jgi:hypothetical protein
MIRFFHTLKARIEARYGSVSPGDVVTIDGKPKNIILTRHVETGDLPRPARSNDLQGIFTVELKHLNFFHLMHSGDNRHVTGVPRSNIRKIPVIH